MANVAAARGARAAGMSFRMIMSLVGGVGVLLLMLPTLIVLVTSFTSGYSLKFPPPGFSLRWYEALVFDSPEIIDALTLSLKLAALATAQPKLPELASLAPDFLRHGSNSLRSQGLGQAFGLRKVGQ